MSGGYPIELDLTGKAAVVIGGGRVALRRTRTLVEAGAKVTVIAPALHPELSTLPVTTLQRRYQHGDLTGAWLVHAATDDPEVNASVATAAQDLGIWCVRADAGSPPGCLPSPGTVT